MKKIAMLLCLTLALLCLAAPALAAEGDTVLMEDGRVRSIFAIGDTFYIDTYCPIDEVSGALPYAVYTWRPGEGEPTILAQGDLSIPGENGWSFITGDETGFYAVAPDYGKIQKLSLSDGVLAEEGEPVLFDTEDLVDLNEYHGEETPFFKQCESWQLMDGKFYFVLEDYEMGPEQRYQVIRIDAATGDVTRFETPYIRQIAPYRDGKLLAVAVDDNNAYNEETGKYNPLTISVFDPETDSLADFCTLPDTLYYDIYELHYNPDLDALYYASSEKIYRCTAGGAPEVAAYVPISFFWSSNGGSISAWVGDTAMMWCNTNGLSGLFVRKADPATVPARALTISGGYASDTHNKTLAAMGDVPVTFVDSSVSSAQELGELLVSGECDIDLFQISLSWMDFTRLMEKGYCYDLTDTPAIKAYYDALYPMIQEAVSLDGHVYGVPIEIEIADYARINKKNLADVGLSAPTSLIGLYDLLNTWGEEEYYDTYSDYTPMDNLSESYKRSLFFDAKDMYECYMAKTGQELTFDTPLFRQICQAIENVDASDYAESPDWEDEDSVDEYFNKKDLISTSYIGDIVPSNRLASENNTVDYCFLSLTDDVEPAAWARLDIFFVNPRSQNIDLALQYITAYIDALNEIDKIAMCPGMNEPVLNPYYDENIKLIEDYIAQLQDSIKTASAADKPALEEELAVEQEYLEEFKTNYRYDATEESIARYRELAQCFVIKTYDPLEDADTAFTRYIEGQINLEQYIQEVESILWKIRNE